MLHSGNIEVRRSNNKSFSSSNMSRNLVFDIMKGIAILLVILGHNGYVPFLIKRFIYSFHMPLFFILSGYFFHQTTTIKNIKRLLFPYIFTGLVVLLYHVLDALPHFNLDMLNLDLAKMFWGSGWYHTSPIFGDKPFIGATWFLCALFWCKIIYGILERNISNPIILGIVCIGISMTSILLDRFCIYLPLSFFTGLSVLVFFYIGHHARVIKTIPWWIVVICIICYIFISLPILGFPLICISNCTYNIYPLTILGSAGGTLLTYYFSKIISQYALIREPLSWIGRLTLPILCFHFIQSSTGCLIPSSASSKILILIIELLFPLLCAWVCSNIGILGRLFGIRTNI